MSVDWTFSTFPTSSISESMFHQKINDLRNPRFGMWFALSLSKGKRKRFKSVGPLDRCSIMLGQLRNEIGQRAVASSCERNCEIFRSRKYEIAKRKIRVRMPRPSREALFSQTCHRKAAETGHRWHKSVSEHLRFTSSVTEFTAASWTTGCSRNASSRKSTTRATMEGRRRNDVHIDTIVLAIAKTPAIDTP